MTDTHPCPKCGGASLIKVGKRQLAGRKVQRWQCKKCGRITHRKIVAEDMEEEGEEK